MSFLNPVNEPVLRFSSTDVGAPQINYNARVAGDVKAVLKACLVTGYGDKASAGWTAANEVGHVAEFLSPDADMIDYRLGIDDASVSSTTWYCQYQDVRTNPLNNTNSKSFASINKISVKSGWDLLATKKGVILVERIHNPNADNQFGRVVYWGRVKSALVGTTGENISFWTVGYNAPIRYPHDFFSPTATNIYCRLGGKSAIRLSSANINAVSILNQVYGETYVDLVSTINLNSDALLIGEQPGVLLKSVANLSDLYGIKDEVFYGRPVLKVCLTVDTPTSSFLMPYARVILIYLDSWGY